MTVVCENGTLRVALSDAETVHYGIDEMFFDGSAEKKHDSLKNLLLIALKKADTTLKSHKVLIEIYPLFNGGCEVFFIPSAPCKRLKVKKSSQTAGRIIAEFKNTDRLLSFSQRLFEEHYQGESQLFKNNGKFQIILDLKKDIETALKEHCCYTSVAPIEIAKTIEYGKLICKNPIEKIGRALG